MSYGHFDDSARAYTIDQPALPRPWINYLGNRRLRAFISQNAGGLLWHLEPHAHRISRYHYLPAPGDQPGFYVYVRDRKRQTLWNPHAAPTFAPLDTFACHHRPGVTTFEASRDGIAVSLSCFIPPDADAMIWQVQVTNRGDEAAELTLCSYLEFGLLEFMREAIGWCYLKSHNSFGYDAEHRAIQYDYRVFEAPYQPRMVFACTAEVSGFECSRDAFCGRTGSLERPAALLKGFGNSELPLGGHGCGALATEVNLAPGERRSFAYVFALGESWDDCWRILDGFPDEAAVDAAMRRTLAFWEERLTATQVTTGDAAVDRFLNTWNPYNCLITLDLARTVSTDHAGLDGLRYRDTTQDALAVANLDPPFARHRMRQVFAQQTAEGGGCFAFYPDNPRPVSDAPRRSDNTVWQIDTVLNLIAETGDWGYLDEPIPFRDGSSGSVCDHLVLGLRYIWERRGPNGLPTLYHADWNDGLAVFMDEKAESVMLGMQLVHACRQLKPLAERSGRAEDVAWCVQVIRELGEILNEAPCWDGNWYTRLILSNGKVLGSASRREGRIYLNPQSWSVLSGVGDFENRGRTAMAAAAAQLATPYGLRILAPPYTGIPEPEDPPLGSRPGTNENGSIFCHANTWAIIAEALLGNGNRAWHYYRHLLPESVIAKVGDDHYEREPYVYVSSITGPPSPLAGKAGISWLTGTASWMYIAATHYLLGIRPTPEGLRLAPCLPDDLDRIAIQRRFRGCLYDIHFERGGTVGLTVDGKPLPGAVVPLATAPVCRVDLHF